MRQFLAGLVVCLVAAPAAAANLVDLTPGRTLRIEFEARSSYLLEPNVLYAFGGYVSILEPYGSIQGALYDGNSLLGASVSEVGAGTSGTYSFYPIPTTWKSPGSPWNFPAGDPATVDFSSILDGTIDGRIDVTIDAGRVRFDLEQVALPVIQAAYANGGQSVPPPLRITSVFVFPELPEDPPPPPPVDPKPPVVSDDDDLFITTSSLAEACVDAGGSGVVFNSPITLVSDGTTSVPVPCTLILGAGVTFDTDQVVLDFHGPLFVQSQGTAVLKLDKSLISASFISIDLRGKGSSYLSTDSSLRATDGNLAVAVGEEGKLEVAGARAGQAAALLASGQMFLDATAKFAGVVVGGDIVAPLGLQWRLRGGQAQLKLADGVVVSTAEGSTTIRATGSGSKLELNKVDFQFGHACTLRLSGSKSSILADTVGFGAATGRSRGGLFLGVGGSEGLVEAKEVDIGSVRNAKIQSSRGGTQGVLKVEKAGIDSRGKVALEASATLEVKDSEIGSARSVRVATSPGGSCTVDSTLLDAPVVESCP